MALVCEAFPPSPPICLLHSLNFKSLVTNVRSFPSTAATARISSKLFPVSTWQSTLSSASCNVHTNQLKPPMLQIFTGILKFCSLLFLPYQSHTEQESHLPSESLKEIKLKKHLILYNYVNNQQDTTTFSFINLFNSALHVSGDKFAHPQEHFKKWSWGWANLSPEICRAEIKRLINEKVVAYCWLFTSLF